MSSLTQGLILSLAGIFITFIYFGLLILVMVLLREIFKVPPQVEKLDDQEMAQDLDRMRAVGIAVSIAILRSRVQKDNRLGKILETPPGRWWRESQPKE